MVRAGCGSIGAAVGMAACLTLGVWCTAMAEGGAGDDGAAVGASRRRERRAFPGAS